MKEELRGAMRAFTRKCRRQTWKKALSILCCVAMLCATCGLTPPAMAREETVFCGKTEHVHGEACYTQTGVKSNAVPVCTLESLNIHQHTDACQGQNGTYSCGCSDFVLHQHDSACYDADGKLWCPLPEIRPHTHGQDCYAPAEPAHVHTDECYAVARGERICAETERQGHAHEAGCYREENVLVCQVTESAGHVHNESCYKEEATLACALPTDDGMHTHGDGCYTTSKTLTCGITEGEGAHTHGEGCYEKRTVLACTIAEDAGHQHTDDCYEKVRGELTCTLSTEPAQPRLICGKQETSQAAEHVHSDACFKTVEETPELTCAIPEGQNGHVHTALCYGAWELTCTLEEHTHTLACYSDKNADLETAKVWEATLPRDIPEAWDEAVLAVAKSQLGYHESEHNYVVNEEGIAKGYSRYGAWAGMPYEDWCAMFVSFCLNYAGIPTGSFPQCSSCVRWVEALRNAGLLRAPEGYDPMPGDLVFFDWEEDGAIDHVGLVAERIENDQGILTEIKTIEGNAENQVKYRRYAIGDTRIWGYGELPENPNPTPTATPIVATNEDPTVDQNASANGEPEETPTVDSDATPTVEPEATATVDPNATATVDPNATATIDPNATATVDPEATATVDPNATATIDPEATATIDPEATATIDPSTADVETAEVWEATLPNPIPENPDEAIVAVAKSQLGYRESATNFIEDEEGNRKNYSRYGEWYGEPYGDWNAMFVAFCMNYAGVSTETFPRDASCASWMETLQTAGLFQTKDVYAPNPGNLVFFDNDGDGVADQVGVVSEVLAEGITVIAGDSANGVHSAAYTGSESSILGYATVNGPVPEPTVDPSTVDVETAEVWEATLPNPIPENWDEAIVAVAKSQLGYHESEINVIQDEEGNSKGYTRYGAWAGEPYGDWNALFASFCLNYAGIPTETFPRDTSCASWVAALQGAGLFQAKDAYAPKPGDLVFFDSDGDGAADRVGVATEMADGSITVIEGDAENQVQSASYTLEDATILGYGALPETPRVEYHWYQYGLEFTATMKKTPDLPENALLMARFLTREEAEGPYAEQIAAIRARVEEEGLNPYVAELYKVYLEADGQEIIPQGNVQLSIRLDGYKYPVLFHNEAITLSDAGMQSTVLDESGVDRAGSVETRLSMLCAILCSRRPDISVLANRASDGGPVEEDITVHKTIDAFRDNVADSDNDNPDTTLDNTASEEEKQDLYRLYLDAQLSNKQVPVDLLLVIDESGSMHTDYGGYTEAQVPPDNPYRDMWDGNERIFRDQALQLVLNGVRDQSRSRPFSNQEFEANKEKGLVSKFLSMNSENNIAVVTFFGGQHADGHYTSYDINDNPDARTIQTPSGTTWTHDVFAVRTNGKQWNATNYCAGLREAMEVFNDPTIQNNGHRKIMLFLSDGEPTLHLIKNANGAYQKGGTGQSDGGPASGFRPSWVQDDGYDTNKSLDFFNDEFRKAHPDVIVYTIGFSESITGAAAGSTGPKALENMAKTGGGSFFPADSTEELRSRIESILYKSLYSDLAIRDQLSANVDLYEKQPDYKVTMLKRDQDGNVLSETTLYENGKITEAGKGKIKENGVGYDPATRTVTAEFEDDYILEVGCTYTLSYNVKTSETAYEDHATHDYSATGGYPDTGDPNTDYKTNATSSNKGGYFSNTIAQMEYRENNGELQHKDYPHPVVQVWEREMNVQKKWLDYDNNDITESMTGSVQFKLMQKGYCDGPTVTPTPATVTVNFYSHSVFGREPKFGTLFTKTVEVGPELTLTFNLARDATINLTDTATGATLPGGTLSATGNAYRGYTYTYKFTVTGDTTLEIEYSGTDFKVNNAELTFTPQEPVQGGPVDVPAVPFTRDHADGIYTISSENGWKETIKNLPKSGKYQGDDPALQGKDVYYSYYVEEVPVDGYTPIIENNESDGNSTIVIQNKSKTKTVSEMPKTGGAGTVPYTMGGLLLMAGSILLYKMKMRRKEGFAPH